MTLAVIAIGRNEGARLEACLASLQGRAARIIYVDSGSVDQSVATARAAGAEVVELSADRPFTAARARSAGYAQLKTGEMPDFVQFIDGDCRVAEGWLEAAQAALAADERFGLVTGWRREIHPEASIYNDLCHDEWDRPEGDILTCGGDMMLRPAAYEAAGGFDATVIAAEDDEFCVRLRAAGWKMRRIPHEMSFHDAAMLRFGQWWQRAVRSGHGFAQVGHMHPPYFAKEIRRVQIYGLVLPVLALLGGLFAPLLFWGVLALYGVNYLRTYRGLTARGMAAPRARRHSVFLTLSKLPNALGLLLFHWRRLKGHSMQIIEYK
ncbi:glycosyltransferase family 2 protein [Cognatishimia sp. SS12]|uniref:glycosyltransferase n=1 Tax=Cognatishimia sp. SS12 TaxID=2979465 RepID=UPI00232A9EC6|nr:glycosyltransferase family 2 protein [Cognatishimia sp. SS12]MDC0736828.1 glycosyltransferase family 2 protein [Cognatishimia sp. SS12]